MRKENKKEIFGFLPYFFFLSLFFTFHLLSPPCAFSERSWISSSVFPVDFLIWAIGHASFLSTFASVNAKDVWTNRSPTDLSRLSSTPFSRFTPTIPLPRLDVNVWRWRGSVNCGWSFSSWVSNEIHKKIRDAVFSPKSRHGSGPLPSV